MDGDDQSTESSGGIIDQITDLASSRPDKISEDEREELVENVTDLLSDDAENREILANHGGAFAIPRIRCFQKNEGMNPRQILQSIIFASKNSPLFFHSIVSFFRLQMCWKIRQPKNSKIALCCHPQRNGKCGGSQEVVFGLVHHAEKDIQWKAGRGKQATSGR